MTMHKKTLSIDFDGTIVEHHFPEVGPLKPGVKEAIDLLKEKYTIVISSCRTSALFNRGIANVHLENMKRCLDDNNIHYDRIDLGNEGKVVASAYIDDRAVKFDNNWEQIARALL